MSTNYKLRCGKCQEQGGYFTRQAWGWGNADIIENTVFLMAHADCYDRYQGEEDEKLEVISEYDDRIGDYYETAKWIENLQSSETKAGNAFPRSSEWEAAKEGNIRQWWDAEKAKQTKELNYCISKLDERRVKLETQKALRKRLENELHFDIEKRVAECIAGGGHHWARIPLTIQTASRLEQEIEGDICNACGLTKTGAMIQ